MHSIPLARGERGANQSRRVASILLKCRPKQVHHQAADGIGGQHRMSSITATSETKPSETAAKLALVTGASSGLGREFAYALAEQGYNLVISARRRDRLMTLRGEIQDRYGRECQLVMADLATSDGVRNLIAACDVMPQPIDTLISNAGWGQYGNFLEQTPTQIEDLLSVNVVAATLLIRHFAGTMAARGTGRILHVASYAGLQPLPRYSVYSGSKSYGIVLMECLRYELRKSPLKLSVLAPGFMETEFHQVAAHKQTRWMRRLQLDPRRVALAGLAGLDRGKTVITPGLGYKINRLFLRMIPRSWNVALGAAVVKSKG